MQQQNAPIPPQTPEAPAASTPPDAATAPATPTPEAAAPSSGDPSSGDPSGTAIPADPGGEGGAAVPEEEGADLAQRIATLEEENRRLKESYLRALAEAENAKRIADKRIEDNSKYAVSNFAKGLLSVADNLGRALLAAPEQARQDNDALRNLAIGVEMTARELDVALEKYQVRRVDALNTAFDPNRHQAVQEVDNPGVPQGTVVQVLQDGYTIHDRLLRPAMVVVSRGGPKRPPKAEDGGDGAGLPPSDTIDTTI